MPDCFWHLHLVSYSLRDFFVLFWGRERQGGENALKHSIACMELGSYFFIFHVFSELFLRGKGCIAKGISSILAFGRHCYPFYTGNTPARIPRGVEAHYRKKAWRAASVFYFPSLKWGGREMNKKRRLMREMMRRVFEILCVVSCCVVQ